MASSRGEVDLRKGLWSRSHSGQRVRREDGSPRGVMRSAWSAAQFVVGALSVAICTCQGTMTHHPPPHPPQESVRWPCHGVIPPLGCSISPLSSSKRRRLLLNKEQLQCTKRQPGRRLVMDTVEVSTCVLWLEYMYCSYCSVDFLRLNAPLSLVNFDQVLHIFLATKEHGATFVDVRRLNVENALGTRRSETTSLRRLY